MTCDKHGMQVQLHYIFWVIIKYGNTDEYLFETAPNSPRENLGGHKKHSFTFVFDFILLIKYDLYCYEKRPFL
jgi:hypothetical protein